MTLDNMTGITEGSYTGFCKSQLITCRFVKNCNGVCPFEDALKHADQTADEQNVIDHDRDWIIGCIEHDGFIKTDRFDKANQIILEALEGRPHGHWIRQDKYFQAFNETVTTYKCSVCGHEPYFGGDISKLNFCPNCGTWMHGKVAWE